MARANTIQTNFTSGELSPNMYGRVDVTKYFNGARKLRNMICLPQGGLVRRPGTEFIREVADSTKLTIVRPFTFSSGDSYVLEFGDGNLRIFQDGALIAAVITGTVPYQDTELADIRIAQSADVLFITHPLYYPRTLTRVSHLAWTIALYDNDDGPYLATTPDVDVTVTNYLDRATATAASAIFTLTGGVKTITNVTIHTTGNQLRVTSAAHGFSDGDTVLITGVVGVPECLGAWRIETDGVNAFILRGSRKHPTSAYVSGGSAQESDFTHVEFREDNKWKLAHVIARTSDTVATVDVMDAIIYPDPVVKISQVSNASVGAVTMQASNSGVFGYDQRYSGIRAQVLGSGESGNPLTWGLAATYIDSDSYDCVRLKVPNFNDPTKEVVISGRAITGTVTATAATFVAGDVGRLLRLGYGAEWVPGVISAYTSSTVVSVTFDREVPLDTGARYALHNGGKATAWKFGAWSSATGYPTAVGFHQGRVVFGGTTAEPTTLWLGVSGDFYDFAPSDAETAAVGDDNSITIVIVSKQVNKIRWLESGPVLLVGTEGGEWQIKPSSIQQTLTPTNYSATQQTAYGSMVADAYRIGSQTIFVERSAQKVREMAYDFSIDSFVSKDLSILSEHLLRENGGVNEWCVQQNPYSFLWIVTNDGYLVGVTYEREHEVCAWHLHDVGGVVESCCVIPTATGEDELWLVVRRTVNGGTKRFLERISDILGTGLNYLDCGKQTDYGTPTQIGSYTVAHLPNTTIAVSCDGVYVGTYATSNPAGNTTIGYTASLIQVGLANVAVIGILDPEGGSQAGTSQAKKKRITESNLRVIDSYYFKTASATIETNETENLTASSDPVDGDRRRIVPALAVNAASPAYPDPTSEDFALVSGDISFSVDDAFDTGARFEIVQDEPYPLRVVALMHQLNTME